MVLPGMLPFVSTYTKFSSSTKFSRTCGVCTHTHVGVDLLNLVLEYDSTRVPLEVPLE